MDIRFLGPLIVEESGVPITPVAATTGQVLALLAVSANRVVPTDVLIDEVWPDGPPPQAWIELRSHIDALRAQIATALRNRGRPAPGAAAAPAPAAADVLADLPGGYRLNSGTGTIDAWEFERAAGAGYRAMEREDFDAAARRLRQALTLWRARAFSDVVAGPHLETEIARLGQSRRRAFDQWIEATLRLGRYRELTADLAVLHDPGPFSEHFVIALHRCSDYRQALAVYRQLRRGLEAEPGSGAGRPAPVDVPVLPVARRRPTLPVRLD
ncbi:AfsR/SARP family transcriptional regulator [Streptomyces sp. NPDC002851]